MLLCPIAKFALSSPQKSAIEIEDSVISYHHLDSLIQNAECTLSTLSLPSKNLALVSHSTLSTIAFYFAALRQGYSVCLLNPKEPEAILKERLNTLKFSLVTYEDAPILSYYPRQVMIPEEQISTYLYTSGSSAAPKIAALSFANHYYSALGILPTLHLDASSRYLLSLPLYHVSGLSIVFRTMISGATLIISKDTSLAYLKNKRVTHLSLVFMQYMKLLKEHPTSTPSYLKAILLGGSAFAHESLKQGLEYDLPLYLSYGLTEMSSAVCCNPLYKTGNYTSSGFLLPYRTLNLSSEGEVLLGGKVRFKGYYCPQTNSLLTQSELLSTQDLAYYSDQTGLCIQGRKDRLIISGGENIQPEEIELKLLSIAGIHQAMVFALPDPLLGKKMVAIIDKESHLSSKQISELLACSLPRYKIPKEFFLWPNHLKSSSLKISSSIKAALYQHILSSKCF